MTMGSLPPREAREAVQEEPGARQEPVEPVARAARQEPVEVKRVDRRERAEAQAPVVA